MDVNILKMIIFSSESTAKDLETDELSKIFKYPYFPLSEKVINALSVSFMNLLCYKVSQKMHQRHAIQMRIVESLRLCAKIDDVFGVLDTYLRNINVTSVATKILMKFLTRQCLKKSSLKTLMYLCELIFSLLPKDDQLKGHLNLVIIEMAKHPSTDKSAEFLENILLDSPAHIDEQIIQKIYINHKQHLIEKPIVDDFCNYVTSSENCDYKLESCKKLLFRYIVRYPIIFQSASVILKEIFVRINYAEITINFTRLFLQELKEACTDLQYLNLYPAQFQACVCLMKIGPRFHSQKTKNNLFNIIQSISINSIDDLLILTMHFPSWIDDVANISSVLHRSVSFSDN